MKRRVMKLGAYLTFLAVVSLFLHTGTRHDSRHETKADSCAICQTTFNSVDTTPPNLAPQPAREIQILLERAAKPFSSVVSSHSPRSPPAA